MTDYKSTIAELHYLEDWAKHHLDKAKIAREAADAIEALQSECAEHKENAIRNARIAVSIRAERDQLQSKLGDAIQSSAHWQHQFTEAQAENEQFRFLAKANSEALGAALAERNALQSKLDAMGKGEPVTDSYVQPVPDKCDRIVWKGRYYHLPIAATKALAPLSRDDVKRICAEADYTHESAQSKADFINGIRHGEKAHGIGGTP